jgi:hypothetical protein
VLDDQLVTFLMSLKLPDSIHPFLVAKRVQTMATFSYFMAGDLDNWMKMALDGPPLPAATQSLVLAYYPRLLTLRTLAIDSGAMVHEVVSPLHPMMTAAIYAVAYGRDRRTNLTRVQQVVTRHNAAAQLRNLEHTAAQTILHSPLDRTKGHALFEASRTITNPGGTTRLFVRIIPNAWPALRVSTRGMVNAAPVSTSSIAPCWAGSPPVTPAT